MTSPGAADPSRDLTVASGSYRTRQSTDASERLFRPKSTTYFGTACDCSTTQSDDSGVDGPGWRVGETADRLGDARAEGSCGGHAGDAAAAGRRDRRGPSPARRLVTYGPPEAPSELPRTVQRNARRSTRSNTPRHSRPSLLSRSGAATFHPLHDGRPFWALFAPNYCPSPYGIDRRHW